MTGLWLTTIGLCIILFTFLGIFISMLKSTLHSQDAHQVDPTQKDHQ